MPKPLVRRTRRARARGAAAFLVFGISIVIAPASQAQFSVLDDPAAPFEWQGHVRALFEAELETETAGGDQFESWTSGIAGGYGGPINESILLGIEAAYQYSDYDFRLDGATGVPSTYGARALPKDPWGSINTIDIAPNTTILIGNQFSLVIAVPIRYSGETGARRNGLSAGASALVRWQITEDLRIGAGIGVTSQLESNAETFPIVTLDWNVTNDLAFESEGNWAQGGKASLLWGPNKAIRVRLSAGYHRNRFRLDDNGFATDRHGIGEITSVPIELGLRLQLFENASFDFGVGLGFAGRLRVESATGRKLHDQRYDPSPRVGLTLTLPFALPNLPQNDF